MGRIDDIIQPLERALEAAREADGDLDAWFASFPYGHHPDMGELDDKIIYASHVAYVLCMSLNEIRHDCADKRFIREGGFSV